MREGGEQFDTRSYDLLAITSHSAPDVPLQKGDRIFVRGEQDRRRAAVVVVRGYVGQEGAYPIASNQTKLSEVLRRAGGLKPEAFISGVAIYRRGYEQRSSVGSSTEIAQITRLSNLSVYDTANFNRQMATRQPAVIVDDRLFLRGDTTADITLSDGDEIVVPERPTTIYVSGFVNNSGFVPYKAGAPSSYYINAAGGFAEGAVKSGTRVIKARSKAWLKSDETAVEPGDEIYVPKEGDYPENYTIQTLGAVSGIAFGLIYLGLTIYDRTKKQ
jgi:protein involved in polysaccharide export with SLBB domain